MILRNIVLPAVLLVVLVLVSGCATTGHQPAARQPGPSKVERAASVEPGVFADLNDMERRADIARELYWQGKYADAARIFIALTDSVHPSSVLYLKELGMVHLALGDYGAAMRCFREVAMLLDSYVDHQLEREALSRFGREDAKIFRGDPYERATAYKLLSMLFLMKGDYDNALAAAKSGILADSDATDNLYESDYTLMHLIEAKCHLLRGSASDFQASRNLAIQSVIDTHPNMRSMISEHRETQELLRMSMQERRRVNSRETDTELHTRLRGIEQEMKAVAASIDAREKLCALGTGEYNTLIVVPIGMGPTKHRAGTDGQLVTFQTKDIEWPRPAIRINGEPLAGVYLSDLADIDFQATTRGGRRMDGILDGQVAFRNTTVGAGSVITDIGSNIGGVAGLAAVLIGATVQGVGGAVTPDADTRSWQLLPSRFDIVALNLPVGRYTLESQPRGYFDLGKPVVRAFDIHAAQALAVIILPPPTISMYSQQIQNGLRLAARDTVSDSSPLVQIPPPLGLQNIIAFDSEERSDRPEMISPDIRRIMRTTRNILTKHSIDSVLVNHEDVVKRYAATIAIAPLALQVSVGKRSKMRQGRETTYKVEFSMSIVDVQKGETLILSNLVGTNVQNTATGGTLAFYECLEAAVSGFVNSDAFLEVVRSLEAGSRD